MVFDVYIMYAYVGVVCAFIIGIILNRTRATAFKNTIDKKLCTVFVFFILFCLFDSAWGLIGSRFASNVPNLYEIASYVFHFFAALSSLFCSWYAAHYFGAKGKIEKILLVIRMAIFAAQLVLLFQNIWTHTFFTVDENGAYHSGVLRSLAFYIQFAQYVPYAIYAVIAGIKKSNDKKVLNRNLLGAFFLMIPLVFGILQMFYPDGAFYSLGFAVFSIAIYSIAVTAERETYLADYNRLETEKKNQKSIAMALDAAKEANNAKSKFLANMSHDIRTPINGITGIVKIAKTEKDPQKLHSYLDKIEGTSQHLLSLVNDVLDMSAIENKQSSILNEEAANIYTIVDNCKSIIGGQLLGRSINFNVEFVGNIANPNIIVDQLRLRQIFINVLGNAIKFTKQGSVDFFIKQAKASSDIVEYQFTIKDTGIGMSQDFINHIFEPFKQENSANGRTNYNGTGLGMTITKQLVDFMKGTIAVESVVNQGSTFVITIPFKISNSLVEHNLSSSVKAFALNGLKVLLVEDNDLNMEIATTILETNGLIVTGANNGKIALDTFVNSNEGAFDFILMDIMMPVMNGYEATEAIRKTDKKDAKTIPIIAMTANAFDEDKKKCILAGMNGHIAKPIDFDNLLKEIGEILGK